MGPRVRKVAKKRMKFFTGDQVGLVKVMEFASSTAVPNPSKKLKSKSKEAVEQTSVKSFGQINRQKGIQVMCWNNESKSELVIGKNDGSVDILSQEGTLQQSFSHFEPDEKVLNKRKKPIHFIGIAAFQDFIITCTDTGLLTCSRGTNCQNVSNLVNLRPYLKFLFL